MELVTPALCLFSGLRSSFVRSCLRFLAGGVFVVLAGALCFCSSFPFCGFRGFPLISFKFSSLMTENIQYLVILSRLSYGSMLWVWEI